MKGFQAIIRRTKRGAVTEVEYHACGGVIKVVFNKRFDSWTLFDSTGKQGQIHPTHIAKMFRAIDERINAIEAVK